MILLVFPSEVNLIYEALIDLLNWASLAWFSQAKLAQFNKILSKYSYNAFYSYKPIYYGDFLQILSQKLYWLSVEIGK